MESDWKEGVANSTGRKLYLCVISIVVVPGNSGR